MRIYIQGLVLLIFLLGCNSKQDHFTGAICISDVSIIDAKNGLQENMTVIIKDNMIWKIKKSSNLNLSKKNKILDGKGKYLIPGLWDAHVHFSYMENLAPSMFNLFLQFGVTSVRDTGGKIDFVNKWKTLADANPMTAPRVKIAGPLIDGMPNVYDGSSSSRPALSVGSGSVKEVLTLVEDLTDKKVDFLKAYEMLTEAQFLAITERARNYKLKVTGHVPLSMDVITASDGGMNSMEHLRNLELSCAENWEELLVERRALLNAGNKDAGGVLRSRIHAAQRIEAIEHYSESQANKVIATLKKNQTWQIPTFTILSGMSHRHFGAPEWIETFELLPDSIGTQWTESVKVFMERAVSDNSKKYTEWAMMITDKINKADIGIMAGTDCPIFFLTPGYSLHQELAYLVEAGLSNLEALESATLRPAEYFGMQEQLGLIEENYIADLLLLDANPLDDITNTLKIAQVFKNGKIYEQP